ncbi:carbohydrate kinase [Aeromicrobium sp. CTD01-1L150]|uniref:carbohydrate kinase family protein n=1 Tax=Aeromicrobium sp. CTD01-1L150 TaxID=3341830 RepID=UPI0035C0B951
MILITGEALVDVVRRPDGTSSAHAGGSPANVAVGLGRLGLPVQLAATLADDEHGHLIRRHLASAGVELLDTLATPDRTASAVATLDGSGAASYDFDITWAPGRIVPTEPPQIVHTGSIASVLEPGADDVEDLVRRQAPTAVVTFDPNIRPSLVPDPARARQRVATLVQLADVVKVSDEDLAWLEPDLQVDDVAQRWLAAGPAAVVVTLGPQGSRTYTASGSLAVPTAAENVVDTVGAGDAFMSGLIGALVQEDLTGPSGSAELRAADLALWQRVSTVAARSAGIVVGRAGSQPPWREELFGPDD